jgi:hypothetical protein
MNKNKFDHLWRQDPGAYELHLKTRFLNPYFPLERRLINETDILEAQERDKQDADDLRTRIFSLADDLSNLSSNLTWGDLDPFRERLEALLERAGSIGGAPVAPYYQWLNNTKSRLLEAAENAFRDAPDDLQSFLNAMESSRQLVATYGSSLMRRILRKDGPVTSTEVIATILSEPVASIQHFFEVHPEVAGLVREEARSTRKELQTQIQELSEAITKLDAVVA